MTVSLDFPSHYLTVRANHVRVKQAKRERLLLLGAAAAALLTFGIRPQTASRALFWWLVQVGGAACAVTALCRDPNLDRYNPIEDLVETHRLQLDRMIAGHEEEINNLKFQHLDELAQIESQLLAQQQQQLAQLKQLFAQDSDDLERHYTELIQAQERQVLELKQQLGYEQSEVAAERERLAQSMQQQWNRLEIESAEVESFRNQLHAEREALHQWAAEQSHLLSQEHNQQIEDLELRRKRAEANLEEMREALTVRFEEDWQKLQKLTQDEIARHLEVIRDLEATVNQQKLMIYTLQKPEYTNGVTSDELLADRVIDYLYEHGVIVRYPEVRPLSKRLPSND